MDLEFIESRRWDDGRFPFGIYWESNLGASLTEFGRKHGVVDYDNGGSAKPKAYPFLPEGFAEGNTVNQLGRLDYAVDLVSTAITERIRRLIDAAIQNPDYTQRRVEADIAYLEREMLNSATLELDELLLLNEMSTAGNQGQLRAFVTPRRIDKINQLIRRFGFRNLPTVTTGGGTGYDLSPCHLVLNAYFIMTEADRQGEFVRIHLPDRSMTSREVLGALRSDSRFKIDESAAEAVHGSFGEFLNYMAKLRGKFFPIYMERPTTEHFEQRGGFFLAPEAALVQPDMRSFIPFSNTLYRSVSLDAPHRIDVDFGSARYRDSGVTSTEWHREWWRVRGSAL